MDKKNDEILNEMDNNLEDLFATADLDSMEILDDANIADDMQLFDNEFENNSLDELNMEQAADWGDIGLDLDLEKFDDEILYEKNLEEDAINSQKALEQDLEPKLVEQVNNEINDISNQKELEELSQDNNLDLFQMMDSAETSEEEQNITEEINQNDFKAEQEEDFSESNDILNMLESTDSNIKENQGQLEELEEIKEKEEPQEDVFALDDILAMEDKEDISKESENKSTSESDISNVFSESLGAVEFGTDKEDISESLLDLVNETEQKKEKKKGLFGKLFGNVTDEKAKKAKEKEEEALLEKEKKKEEKRLEKEKAFGVDEEGNPISKEDAKKAKKEAKELAKKEKKELKQQQKQAKLEEKEKKKEEAVEIEEEPSRINRVGATIVMVFCTILTIVIITGTNSFAYSQSIQNATDYFEIRKYTKAYNEVSGITIKERDKEIYDKIITVMYVNKQLNSYNNYYSMKMYPEALDSLLKGMKRYDKYLTTAKQLGIVSDLQYVRKQIITELNSTYNLSEEEAYAIINAASQEEYSKKVISAAVIQ